jgi:hypothetical protein
VHSDLDRLLLARVAAGATAVVVGGDPAVTWELETRAPSETETETETEPESGSGRVLRRRAVLARVVGQENLLVSIVLTVVADTGPYTAGRHEVVDAFTELFDAMLTTVRWRDGAGRLITDRATV